MGEFLKGAGHLGLTPGVTVVPAAVWGVQHLMRGWRPVGRGPVLVAFGHPVPVPEDGSRRERAAELTRRTRHAVGELLEPMMRAHP
jgi:1-acyl-sn-glycerol-3-phosphate acyltransferase